jgi:Na+/H+-translocating membrane pyrophosphatase
MTVYGNGPIIDNAGEIADMAGMSIEFVRELMLSMLLETELLQLEK